MRPVRRLVVTTVIVVGVLVAGAPPAGAHAEVRESDPTAGGTAPTGQDEVTITFISMDADVPPEIDVLDPDGKSILTAEPAVGGTTTMGTIVTVPVAPLEEGRHLVTWQAMSSDGDGVATGTFEFVAEERSGGGLGLWLLWIVALAVPAAIFLRPGARRQRDET